MKILVCVKQVPDTTIIKIDPVTNTLIRTGVPSILNPFDAQALGMALSLRESEGGTVTVLSMGPMQAAAVLRESLALGADRAWLLSDRAFGGSDTLATSYILSCAIRRLEGEEGAFDLILCGKQAIDGDTGQVGPELAEHLNRAQVTYVSGVQSLEGASITVLRDNEHDTEVVKAALPAVLSVVKTGGAPRYPSIRSIAASWEEEIPVLTAADLTMDAARAGLHGSPTKVKKTFTPDQSKAGVLIREPTAAQSTGKLLELLGAARIL